MAIIKQFDKRSGITYVYDSKSYYDKEKKCSRAKRTLIGKLDPETGEIIPTDGRNKGAKSKPELLFRPLPKWVSRNHIFYLYFLEKCVKSGVLRTFLLPFMWLCVIIIS